MTIELIDRFTPELDDLALEAANASFYQTSAWIESVEASFPQMEFACIVARKDSRPVGYLPFFKIRKGPFTVLQSMPFSTYGGPVFLGDEAIAVDLLEAYERLCRASTVLEGFWVDFWNLGFAGGFGAERASTQIIDLTRGFDRIWNRCFDKAKRRQARKGRREGLVVSEATTQEEVDRYVDLYVARASSWGAGPVYPRKLFEELLRRGGGRARLFLVHRGDEFLGGHLNFYFKDMVIAWNGVTERGEAGHQAATFLYSSLIEQACESGFARYNLGGSLGKPGLIQYKASLGGEFYGYRIRRRVSTAGRLAGVLKRFVRRRR